MWPVNGKAYKLLGYIVWKGAKWYLRQRLPSARTLALGGLAAGGVLTAVVLIARRAAG
jgi:hypothetical protein